MERPQDFRREGYYTIDGKRYNIQELTCKQLEKHFGTGRAILISGTGRDKKYLYRNGYMTDIGDVLEADWLELAKYLIERENEHQLFSCLLEWVTDNVLWCHTKQERERYALELHMARIFDQKDWVDYKEFNKKHRPEKIQDGEEGE